MPSDATGRLAALSDEQRQLLAKRLAGRSQRGQGHDPSSTRTIPRRGQEIDLVPLSFAQQRIWFLSQLDPSSGTWSVGRPIRLRGLLELNALRRSVTEIIRRHESLRTVFPVTGAQPMQRVLPVVEQHQLEVIDLSQLAPGDRCTEALRQVAEVYHRPWPLERGPLVRAAVWQLADDDHVLLFLAHHIVADGWAWGLVERELMALYQVFNDGRPPLPELPIQYPDFAIWQNQWAESAECERQIDWWKAELAALPKTELPRNRPAAGGGVSRQLVLSAELTQALRTFCRREGATLFMGLLAAFAALLSRYTGQDDIVIGSPIANRHRPELENMIGCFMNPLPLRIDVSGKPSFAALLRRVRARALSVYEHQDVPFDLLVRVLQPKRDPTSPPLFQSLLILQNFPWDRLTLSPSNSGGAADEFGRRVDDLAFELEHGDLAYPVAIIAYERGDDVLCVFEHESAFTTVLSRAREHFLQLLEAAMAEPDRALEELTILTSEERQQVLVEWNHRQARYADTSVHRLFEAAAARTPAATAVVCGPERMCYGDLNARANVLAAHLRSRGVGPEVRVGVLVERSIEMVVAVLAVMKAGGAYVPLDPAYPSDRLRFIVRDAAVTLLVTQRGVSAQAEAIGAGSGGPACCVLEDVWTDGSGVSVADVAAGDDLDTLAYVIYTSGSTGQPKGTMVTHANLANAYRAWEDVYALSSIGSHLQMASVSFDVFTGDLVRALCSGATLVLVPQDLLFAPERLYELMYVEGVQAAEFVPAVLRNLVSYLERTQQRMDFMRLLVVGSDSWYGRELAQVRCLVGPETRVINSYGLTEATIDSTYFDGRAEDVAPEGLVPLGRAFPNTEILLLDRQLQPVPIGVPAQLFVGGASLARGYLNRPDLTAERFIPHPFSAEPGARLYGTGDLARYLPDGTLELLGRQDHQVKLRGFRIELGEVESVLVRHRSVRDAAVIVREDQPGDRRLVAYVVRVPADATGAGELRRSLRDDLPEHMIPSAIVMLDALPLTPNGKVDRKVLPPPDGRQRLEEEFIPPQTDTERRMAAVWREVLQLEQVGVNDNFFDLGGHSLLIVQLHRRIRSTFDVEIAVVDLFRYPTIRALACRLSRPEANEDQVGLGDARDRASKQRMALSRRRPALDTVRSA